MIRCDLDRFWRQKEAELNRDITFLEVAEKTGINRDTISRLFNRKTDRYDSEVVAKIAEFFGVEDGQPIPFLVLDVEEVATR